MAAYVQKSPAADSAYGSSIDVVPPELSEIDYLSQVLNISKEETATHIASLYNRAEELGIAVSRLSEPSLLNGKPNTLSTVAESSVTVDTSHARSSSTGSQDSAITTVTSHYSNGPPESAANNLLRKRSRTLSFSQYDNYLASIDRNLNQPKFLSIPSPPPPPPAKDVAPSLFSVGTRNSLVSIKNGLTKLRRRRKTSPFPEPMIVCCSACREDFKPDQTLEKLPCGHTYCTNCLRIMVNQSSTEESKMPPRCCTQPVPGSIVRSVLTREEQSAFLKAVLQFSTPWEARIFCSSPVCGEFIPPRNKIDPKRPFQVTCRKCRTTVCVMCKRNAHPLGKDCPYDWELDAVLKIGEKSGWRRCYKCRTLVELAQGCTHMTCRCRAQFCYICGAIWDQEIGCPNFCNGDEEMERRRLEEEARIAAIEAEDALRKEQAEREAAELRDAQQRTDECAEFKALREDQIQEMERFQIFERKSKWLMWTRHAQQKLALMEKQSASLDKMRERHGKTSANLEDRQVSAEMELRANLSQSERNVRIRLRHMEAYCDGLGQKPSSDMPARVVTERDLRELGQQYNVEKNMQQLHEARINVMRDRQAKALEDLLERQETEMDRLLEKNTRELETLATEFADEEEALSATFQQRKDSLEVRWELASEILRKELEREKQLRFTNPAPLNWPLENNTRQDNLAPVEEYAEMA